MNPLINNQSVTNQLSPELISTINRMKQMNIMNNQSMINQAIQMCNNMSPEQVVRIICSQRGIDVNQLMNAIRN